MEEPFSFPSGSSESPTPTSAQSTRVVWMCGLVGGWMVIKRVLRFSLFLSMLTSKISWFQKWCQKLSTAFLSKVMSTLKIQTSTKEDRVPIGKTAKIIYWRKMRLSPAESYWSFPKNPIDKMWFQEQKYEKYLKSKNDIKRPLGPFNKELWAI